MKIKSGDHAGPKDLNARQMRFCELMIAGHGSNKAYALAYDIPEEKQCNATVGVRGSRMLTNPKVIAHMDKIRQPVLMRLGLTLEHHLDKLEEIRDAALEAKNFGAACTAEIARGKAGGLYVERSESLVRSLHANVTVSPEQLKDVAAALLTKI